MTLRISVTSGDGTGVIMTLRLSGLQGLQDFRRDFALWTATLGFQDFMDFW
jgi:hypothetical protein